MGFSDQYRSELLMFGMQVRLILGCARESGVDPIIEIYGKQLRSLD
jgi:hypothetical protein